MPKFEVCTVNFKLYGLSSKNMYGTVSGEAAGYIVYSRLYQKGNTSRHVAYANDGNIYVSDG